MALITNSFEGGSDGTTITTANSGGASGTAFDTITGDVTQFSNVLPAHGTLGGRCASRATAAKANLQWVAAHGNLAVEAGRCYFAMDAAPTTNCECVVLQDSGLVTKAQIRILTDRTWKLVGTGASAAGSALALNTQYRFEWKYDTAGATVTANLYLGDSTTVI